MPKIKGSRISSAVFQGFQETCDGGSIFQSTPRVLYPKEEIRGMRAADTSHILGLYRIPSGQLVVKETNMGTCSKLRGQQCREKTKVL